MQQRHKLWYHYSFTEQQATNPKSKSSQFIISRNPPKPIQSARNTWRRFGTRHADQTTKTQCRKGGGEALSTCRPARTQSPETRRTLSARCLDDTELRWMSYAFDTAAAAIGTCTFAWHTLHSTSPLISPTAASPKTLRFRSLPLQITQKHQQNSPKKSRKKTKQNKIKSEPALAGTN